MIVRRSLPRIVQRGADVSLDLDIYSDAGDQQTTTSGTVDIYLGGKQIVDGAAITAGAPSTYALAAATTSSESLSDEYLEVWTVVISGTTYTLHVEGYLVRRAYYPSITDTDLSDRQSELATFSASLGGYQKYRDEANTVVQLELLQRGRRPWLVFDRYVLRLLQIYKALELLNGDFKTIMGDGKYERRQSEFAALYADLLGTANFRYDDNESGTIDNEDHTAASGNVFITAGPGRGGRRGGYRTP
jgi:hypothetical protein